MNYSNRISFSHRTLCCLVVIIRCPRRATTYTLVEDYDLSISKNNPNKLNHVYHFDLYRLGDPEELEYLGGRDYFANDAVCLVEWPQRGEGWLTEADLEITLEYQENARIIKLLGCSHAGKLMIDKLNKLDD